MWLFLVITHPAEPGATWELTFGILDFLPYFLVGVPQFVVEAGVSSGANAAYPMFFAIVGSLQWFGVGFLIVYLYKVVARVKSANHRRQLTGNAHER